MKNVYSIAKELIKSKLYHIVWKLLYSEQNLGIYNLCKKYVDDFNGDNNSNFYTNGELDFLKKTLPDCDVVFDVGAHIGNWSKLALEINSKISLHCFEPSKSTFLKLKSNNFLPNVKCNNFGLGDKRGNKRLYIFNEESGLNSLYKRKGLEDTGSGTQNRVELVRIDTIDNYCYENKIPFIDFLKIDVEGYDFNVIKGANSMIKDEKIKIIQFEYGQCNADARVFLRDIFEYFKETDYTFYKIFPGNIKHIERYTWELENFQYSNYLVMLT